MFSLPTLLVITALASGALSGGAAWYVQGLRGDNQVLELTGKQKDSQITSLGVLIDENIRLQKEKDYAIAQADLKVQAAQRTAANASRAAERLQSNLANATTIADATESSLRAYTVTLTGLFSRCTREYQAMGERAYGHALDVQEHRAAWPKSATPQVTTEPAAAK
jgi:hypothetical protein